MLTDENHPLPHEAKTPVISPGNYSPLIVDMNGNSLGAIFLGILAFLLLIGWMRTETHYYRLLEQLTEHETASSRL